MAAGDGAGDQGRLIVAARPDSPPMERHRDHDRRVRPGTGWNQPVEPARDRPRQPLPAAIFELERDPARDVAISHRRAGAVESGRIGKTPAAPGAGAAVVGERRAAAGAAGRPEKIELLPAVGAKTMVGLGHGAATGAARRQREGEQPRRHGGEKAERGHRRLVSRRRHAHKSAMAAPSDPIEIFDRTLRRRRRDRAAAHFRNHAFVRDHMVAELLERLASVKRDFSRALDLGAADGRLGEALRARGLHVVAADSGFAFARACGGVQCDEDRLPFADGSFDLVIAAGGLDMVNDLPGALTLIRRLLVPDGLFLAGFAGAGSLPRLREALLAADLAVGGAAPRLHPQIDVRAAGNLLSRAGFALPVADSETLSVRYGDPLRLVADLRGMAATNVLCDGAPPLGRVQVAALLAEFAAAADADGRTTEQIEIVYLTGWSPAPDQPKPARRGSGTRSLAAALRPPSRL